MDKKLRIVKVIERGAGPAHEYATVQCVYACTLHGDQPAVETLDYLPGNGREMGDVPSCSACEIEDVEKRLANLKSQVETGGESFTVFSSDIEWPDVLAIINKC